MANNTTSPVFENKEEFRAWRKGNPTHYGALEKIIFAWRGSSARITAEPNRGIWAVYDLHEWMKKTGLSYDQVKRAFSDLHKAGLIERERHRWGGSNNLTWVRPTALALDYMSNRPQDKARLGTAPKTLKKPAGAPPLAPPLALPDALPLALSDYTSFPSSSINPTDQQADFSSSPEEGKGKAGGNTKSGGNVVKLKFPAKTVAPAPEPVDEIEAMAAKHKAKKLDKLKAAYPPIEGPHKHAVKHPADFYSWAHFASWSEAKRAEKYAQYLEYVANWKGGQAAKAVAADDMSDEAWAALCAQTAAAVAEDKASGGWGQ